MDAFVGTKGTRAAGEYHSKDFAWNEVVEDGLAAIRRQEEERRAAATSAAAPSIPNQTVQWESFHRKQGKSAKFFKERRYLMLEFPILQDSGRPLHVVEIGCGCGSNVLPLLRDNSNAHVTAFDIAPAAVEHVQWALQELQIDTHRCSVFDFDPLAADADVERAAALKALGADVAMLIFTLSALPSESMPCLLDAAYSYLRPGGCLLFRDYG